MFGRKRLRYCARCDAVSERGAQTHIYAHARHTKIMCGRYYVSANDTNMKKYADKLSLDLTGDIFPSMKAPVITKNGVVCGIWGWKNVLKGKRLLINARAETAYKLPVFAQRFANERCLVPCNGFYEWDADKRKYLFVPQNGKTLYLCGIARFTDEICEYTVLTKAATPPVDRFHDRIPVIADEMCERFLHDYSFACRFVAEPSAVPLICVNA